MPVTATAVALRFLILLLVVGIKGNRGSIRLLVRLLVGLLVGLLRRIDRSIRRDRLVLLTCWLGRWMLVRLLVRMGRSGGRVWLMVGLRLCTC